MAKKENRVFVLISVTTLHYNNIKFIKYKIQKTKKHGEKSDRLYKVSKGRCKALNNGISFRLGKREFQF